MSDRLDRLEALAETILLAVQQQQTQIGDLRESIADTVGMIGSLAEEMHIMQNEIRDIQLDIRGLQTENRRILERLEAHFSDGHGAA